MKGQQLSFAAGQARRPCRCALLFQNCLRKRSLPRALCPQRKQQESLMRTSILATTAAIGMAIAAPAQAQQSTAPGQQQIQSDKQMQEERIKASRPATPEHPDLSDNSKRQLLPRIRPVVPIRAAARPRVRAPVQLAARVPRPVARHASVLPVRVGAVLFSGCTFC
jgi:hypothetical protein